MHPNFFNPQSIWFKKNQQKQMLKQHLARNIPHSYSKRTSNIALYITACFWIIEIKNKSVLVYGRHNVNLFLVHNLVRICTNEWQFLEEQWPLSWLTFKNLLIVNSCVLNYYERHKACKERIPRSSCFNFKTCAYLLSFLKHPTAVYV